MCWLCWRFTGSLRCPFFALIGEGCFIRALSFGLFMVSLCLSRCLPVCGRDATYPFVAAGAFLRRSVFKAASGWRAAERNTVPPTKAGVVEYFRMLLAAFPDLQMATEDVIASGEKAVARVRVTGTHKGAFMGIPATGRRVDVTLIDITRFGDDGRACEHWGVVDQLAMMQQLGAIPAGPPA